MVFKLKDKKKPQKQNDISIALIWTKYQYHILLALLRELGIDRSSVLLIVFSKAQRHGVKGEDFFETVFYDAEEYVSIKDWPRVKQDIYKLMKSFDFYPCNLLLRSYDSAIGRMLLSQYPNASVYLFEDGTTSYKKRSFLGYPFGKKDKIRNVFLRFYFSTSLLRVLPVLKKNAFRAGLFPTVDSWLKVPYIPVTLIKKDFFKNNMKKHRQPVNNKILILEQPLWQAGLEDKVLIHAYQEMIIYILSCFGEDENAIALKMHPSSDEKRLREILKKAQVDDNIEILDTKHNLEEMILFNELESIEMIISFCSSGLYVSKSLLGEANIRIVAFSTKELYNLCHKEFAMYEEMEVIHIKGAGSK